MDHLDRGTGPAILLIHGFPLDRRIWDAQVEGLAARFRVIAPDLPGHGKSPIDTRPYTMEHFARGLLGLADALGVRRFVAAGHSMGGYILFALHRLAPERLAGAALVSTRANPDTEEGRKAREETARRAEREGVGFLADQMPARVTAPGPRPEVLERLRLIMSEAQPAGVAAASRAMAARPDATPRLADFRIPALVLAGRGDRIVPPAESEAMARAIPGARLVWCERSGHLPMMEEPEVVTRELADLARVSGAAGA